MASPVRAQRRAGCGRFRSHVVRVEFLGDATALAADDLAFDAIAELDPELDRPAREVVGHVDRRLEVVEVVGRIESTRIVHDLQILPLQVRAQDLKIVYDPGGFYS